MKKIRLLIADDHKLVREGLRTLLEGQGEFQVVAEAANGHEAVERALQVRPDVVLMDIGMPDMDGLEATRRIVEKAGAIPVLVLTVHEEDDYFFRALEAGAHGFVLKDADSRDLAAAVRAVHAGGTFLYPSMATKLVEDYLQRVNMGEERESYERLTRREQEVLRLVGEGRTNAEIASLLYISINTVQNHRSHIMEKLNLHSRAELMKYAVRMGLLRRRS